MDSTDNSRERLDTIPEIPNESSNMSETEKKYFEEDNNFIDYFVEIGVIPEIFKNNSLYNSKSINDINNNLIPQIITKFPKIDKKYIVIENTLIQQIFPHGFNAVDAEAKPDPEFYSIILDNQLYSATYTHKYFACLLIYESIEEYEKLNEKYKSTDILASFMNPKASEEIKNDEKKYKNYYIPKCLCIVSVYPFFNRFEEILRALYELVISNKYNTLYIDRIIEKMIVETPKLPRGCKRIFLKLPNKTIDLTEKRMNDYPNININLSKLFGTLKVSNIIEIFRYLLFETKIIFFSSKLYDLTNTIMSILSLITPFKYQFQVVSVLPKELYNFIETISPYIFGINESYDTNFIQNNNITLEDTTICIVDIDQDKYYIISTDEKSKNEDFPDFPKHLKDKIEKEYNNYIQELINKAKDMNLKKIEDNDENNDNNLMDIKEDNQIYQLIFFNFMIYLLKDYPKFLSKDYGVTKDISMNVKDMIDTNGYLNSINSNERDFYKRIFNTQMFIEFIFKRMMPKDCNEKVDILFFEEKINEKMSSKKLFGKSKTKDQNILLSSKEYDYEEDNLIIDCSTEIGITETVFEHLIKNKVMVQKDFLNNGYDIQIDEQNNKLLFNYHIFPSLLSDQFFSLNYQFYNIPIPYYKQIDLINSSIVNKSHLKFNNKVLKISEMGNDLYLCYLIVWSLTIWYTDSWEREFRFLKMIEIIEKVEAHEIEIFELLFKAIVNHCNDKDTVLLYKKFIHLNLNPTWSIFSLVSKIIKKKTNIKNKKELLSQQTKFKDLKSKSDIIVNKNSNEISNFRSRTLKTKEVDDKILSEDVIFYAYGFCKSCGDYINLMNLCSDLLHLSTKTEEGKDYFKCPNKHQKNNNEYIQLKLTLNFGVELYNLKLKTNKQSTSSSYIIELMSPTTIKKRLLQIAKDLGEEKFNVEMFKRDYKELFWNLVWFFELNNMDISFMLPYSYESCNIINDTNSEKIKQSVITKYKQDIDIDIEKIVKSPDLNVSIIFYGNVEALGEKIDQEEIKSNVFSLLKYQYNADDLVIQKAFQFKFDNKIGMIGYLEADAFSENIGFNEYPSQFEEIKFIEHQNSFISSRSISGSINLYSINNSLPSKHFENINKTNSFNLANKNYSKLKTVNFTDKSAKSTNFKKLHKKSGGILKHSRKNLPITTDIEINNKIEDIDFLSKFKESQKKIENSLLMGKKTEENKKTTNNNNNLRNSTLKNGILFESKKEDNDEYDDEEE